MPAFRWDPAKGVTPVVKPGEVVHERAWKAEDPEPMMWNDPVKEGGRKDAFYAIWNEYWRLLAARPGFGRVVRHVEYGLFNGEPVEPEPPEMEEWDDVESL